MLGKITVQELSQELIDFINSSGGGSSSNIYGKLICKQATITATTNNQKEFNLPEELEYKITDIPIVTINTVLLPDDKYIMTSQKLTITATEGVSSGSIIRIMLLSIDAIDPPSITNITKEQLSAALVAELDGKALAVHTHTEYSSSTHNHNNDYAPKIHTHQDIIDQIPDLPAIATTIEAETGLDNTKMMTPVRVKEAIRALAGSGGSVLNNVFLSGTMRDKFIATVDNTTTFTIDSLTVDKEVLIIYNNLICNEGVDYEINKTTKVVTLNQAINTGEIIYYIIFDGSYQYNDLSGKPDIVNNLTTGGIDKVLSAEQGKVLKEELLSNTNKIGVLSNDRGYLTSKIFSSGNVSSLNKNGIYQVDTSVITGVPENFGVAWVYVVGNDATFFVQTMQYVSKNVTYEQRYANGIPGGWKQLTTTDKTVNIGFGDKSIIVTGKNILTIGQGKYFGVPINGAVDGVAYYDVSEGDNGNYRRIVCRDWSSINTYENQCANGNWTGWKQIATTDKTEILLTPKASFTILDNKSYKINNELYINVQLKKTDGSDFIADAFVQVITLPQSVYDTSLNFISQVNGWYKGNGNSLAYDTNIAVTPSQNCQQIRVSGVIVL